MKKHWQYGGKTHPLFSKGELMAQALEDCVSRLEQMVEQGQQTWDLSPNDQEAIRLAVRVLNVIQYLDQMPAWVESGPIQGGGVSLNIGVREFDAATHLECFSKAGADLAE